MELIKEFLHWQAGPSASAAAPHSERALLVTCVRCCVRAVTNTSSVACVRKDQALRLKLGDEPGYTCSLHRSYFSL
eukprot:2822076-Rhodomonas_salina.2